MTELPPAYLCFIYLQHLKHLCPRAPVCLSGDRAWYESFHILSMPFIDHGSLLHTLGDYSRIRQPFNLPMYLWLRLTSFVLMSFCYIKQGHTVWDTGVILLYLDEFQGVLRRIVGILKVQYPIPLQNSYHDQTLSSACDSSRILSVWPHTVCVSLPELYF